MNLNEVSAHIEIKQVLYKYCRGVDRGDAELIKSIYHPDAIDEHGPFWQGTGMDFADMIVEEMDKCSAIGQHHITNVLIDLNGDTASVESYFLALNPVTDPEGTIVPVAGRYLDRFERRNGKWKIAHRQVILDWSQIPRPINEWPVHGEFPNGGRHEEDPSSEFIFPRK